MSFGKRYNTPDNESEEFQYLFGKPLYVDKNAKYKSLEANKNQPSAPCKDKNTSIPSDINIKNTCSERITSKSSKSETIIKGKEENKKFKKEAESQLPTSTQAAAVPKSHSLPNLKINEMKKMKHEKNAEIVKIKKEEQKELKTTNSQKPQSSNLNQVSQKQFNSNSTIAPIKLQEKTGETAGKKNMPSLFDTPTKSTTSMTSTVTKPKSPKQTVNNKELKEKTESCPNTKKEQPLNRDQDVQKNKLSQNLPRLETNTMISNSYNSTASVSTHQNTVGTKKYTKSIFDPPDPKQPPDAIPSLAVNTAEISKYTPSIFDPPDPKPHQNTIPSLAVNTAEISKYTPSIFDPPDPKPHQNTIPSLAVNTAEISKYTPSIFDPPDPKPHHNAIPNLAVNTAEISKYTPSVFDPPVPLLNAENNFTQNISNLTVNNSEKHKNIPSVFDPCVNIHVAQSALVYNASSLSINSANTVLNANNNDECYKQQQIPNIPVSSSNTKLALQSAYNNKRRIATQQRYLEPIEKAKKIERVVKALNTAKVQPKNSNKKITVINNKNLQEYWIILKELNNQISQLSGAKLQKVAELIAKTGLFEMTADTFDFDLCQLDRPTIKQLQLLFAKEENV